MDYKIFGRFCTHAKGNWNFSALQSTSNQLYVVYFYKLPLY